MTIDREKQEPIFSKLQDVFGVFPPSTSSPEPPDQNEEPDQLHSEAKEDVNPSPSLTLHSTEVSPPENLVVMEVEKKVEAVSPRIIQPPQELKKTANSLGMTFVLIPAGTFLMGSPEHEPGRNDDEIQHKVTLSQDFYLQTTPVTQAQWEALTDSNPSSFVQGGSDLPVEGVSWQDCQEFINKLNDLREGTYRLPTEAEWEYACRAGSTTALANGDLVTLSWELDPNLDELGWYCGNYGGRPQPVAQKRPNNWGLYDMHGNVWEWVQDWYGPYPETPQTDPSGPPSGPGRVARGGSWCSSARNCRAAARFHLPPQSRSQLETKGLRLVMAVQPS